MENEAALQAREKAEKKQQLLSLISKKKDEEMKGKSLEELNQLLASL